MIPPFLLTASGDRDKPDMAWKVDLEGGELWLTSGGVLDTCRQRGNDTAL